MKLNFALQNYVLILNKLHQKQQRARENIQSTLLLCFVGDLLKPISHILHDLFYVQKHPLQRPFSSKKGKFHIYLHQPRTRRSRTPSHRRTPAPEPSLPPRPDGLIDGREDDHRHDRKPHDDHAEDHVAAIWRLENHDHLIA
uniref:Uncharacterized protein n=1 Tax=Ananas comosus var. bracteatus TaxID=296719 RepID=A0A6V7NWR5_ANACO|nr:unnamed protein product [Ananas comosus var. bracteatus]